MYLHVEHSAMVAMYAKCYIITKGSVSAGKFTFKSDTSLSFKTTLNFINIT